MPLSQPGFTAFQATEGRLCARPNLSFDKRPRNPADNRVPEPDEPRLRPIQVHVRRPAAENTQRMKRIVRRPLPLERLHGPIPHLALRKPLSDRPQLALELLLRNLERRFQVDIVRRHGDATVIPGLTGNLTYILTLTFPCHSEPAFPCHFELVEKSHFLLS